MPCINHLFLTLTLICVLPLSAQKPLHARVSPYQGRPTIFLNDIPQTPLLYSLTDVPGGRQSWDELPQHNLRRFCEDGIRMYQVDVFLEQLWPDSQHFELDYARKQVRGILEACPEAAVFIRLHLDPPRWWTQTHPEENTVYDDASTSPDWSEGLQRYVEADPRNPMRTSLASTLWQGEAMERLRIFCRRFSKTKEGKRVAGIQVASGVYGEWHYWGFLKYEADISPAMRTCFQSWLKQQYKTDEALQTAWNQPGISLNQVETPGKSERARRSGQNFRLPGADQHVIDYYRCQHERVAELIRSYAACIKKHWGRPVITGAFYGYFFSCFSRQAAGGHLALQKLLQAPELDYLAGPQAYLPQAEKPGEAYRSRSLILSLHLHGKLWLDEMDQQPRRVFPFSGGVKDNKEKYEDVIRENVAQLRRNLMFTHAKGMGLWLYDFGLAGINLGKENEQSPQHGITGYWDHSAYHQEIKHFLTIANQSLHKPYRSEADILLVYDTEPEFYQRSLAEDKDSLSLQLIDYMSLSLYQSSVVFDPVHLADLPLTDIGAYKAVIFANCFVIDPLTRRWIKEKVCADQRHVFWFYAPGYLDGKKADVASISTLTGMDVAVLDTLANSSVVIVDSNLVKNIRERAWGQNRPLFCVRENQERVLGRYAQNGAAAIVKKSTASHVSLYSTVPILSQDLWKKLLTEAGVHCYGEKRDVFYGGSGILTFHSKNPGECNIHLKSGKVLQLKLPEKPVTLRFDVNSESLIDKL